MALQVHPTQLLSRPHSSGKIPSCSVFPPPQAPRTPRPPLVPVIHQLWVSPTFFFLLPSRLVHQSCAAICEALTRGRLPLMPCAPHEAPQPEHRGWSMSDAPAWDRSSLVHLESSKSSFKTHWKWCCLLEPSLTPAARTNSRVSLYHPHPRLLQHLGPGPWLCSEGVTPGVGACASRGQCRQTQEAGESWMSGWLVDRGAGQVWRGPHLLCVLSKDPVHLEDTGDATSAIMPQPLPQSSWGLEVELSHLLCHHLGTVTQRGRLLDSPFTWFPCTPGGGDGCPGDEKTDKG